MIWHISSSCKFNCHHIFAFSCLTIALLLRVQIDIVLLQQWSIKLLIFMQRLVWHRWLSNDFVNFCLSYIIFVLRQYFTYSFNHSCHNTIYKTVSEDKNLVMCDEKLQHHSSHRLNSSHRWDSSQSLLILHWNNFLMSISLLSFNFLELNKQHEEMLMN